MVLAVSGGVGSLMLEAWRRLRLREVEVATRGAGDEDPTTEDVSIARRLRFASPCEPVAGLLSFGTVEGPA